MSIALRVRVEEVQTLSDDTVLEAGMDEAVAMIDSGAIRDGKTIILLQHAALHLLRS